MQEGSGKIAEEQGTRNEERGTRNEERGKSSAAIPFLQARTRQIDAGRSKTPKTKAAAAAALHAPQNPRTMLLVIPLKSVKEEERTPIELETFVCCELVTYIKQPRC